MWLVLRTKVLTWDVLQRSGQGPGWHILCTLEEESIDHFLNKCIYAKQICDGCFQWIADFGEVKFSNVWGIGFSKKIFKVFRALQLVVAQGIWLVRNAKIFQGKYQPAFPCASHVRSFYGSLKGNPQSCEGKDSCTACNWQNWGLGLFWWCMLRPEYIIHLDETYSITFKVGMVFGSNNYGYQLSWQQKKVY